MPIVRVDGTAPVDLAQIDPDAVGEVKDKASAQDRLKTERKRIIALQERLFAERSQSLLVVLQAIDTGGKDGTIRKVFRGVNPQGCQVASFGVPSEDDLAHDPLRRYHLRTPRKGMIGIFNRSHYEEVLAVRVRELVEPHVWKGRYEEIREFEELLSRNDTRILKFYLHISKDEQRSRLQERLDDPTKHWKFRIGDLDDRRFWDAYQAAFQDAINLCATPDSPWYVVPANRKWHRDLVVAQTIANTLDGMNPQWPEEEEGLASVVIPE